MDRQQFPHFLDFLVDVNKRDIYTSLAGNDGITMRASE